MSTFKVDLDYNAAHVKGKILILEAIYQELLRQEKADEDEEEQRRNKCRILKRENAVLKHLVELHEGEEQSKEIEPIPEPIVEPVVVEEPKKRPDKIICECGMEIVKRNMKRHCTSKNHIFNMEIKKKGNVVPL
jgi:hypothetical protein